MAKPTSPKTAFLIVVAVAVVGGLFFYFELNRLSSTGENLSSDENTQEEIKKEATLVIDDGTDAPKIFALELKEGMTAFDLLKNKTDESAIVLETKTYDVGIFVESIGGKKNGAGGKYWLYYVNGEMPSVAADKKELKTGDKVEFKFEKSPF